MDSETTMEVSADDEEKTTRMRDWRQRQRRQGIDNRPKGSMRMMEASEEEDDHEDYNNDNGGIGGE